MQWEFHYKISVDIQHINNYQNTLSSLFYNKILGNFDKKMRIVDELILLKNLTILEK